MGNDKDCHNIIHEPLLNKGTAFTLEERKKFGLEGRLPPHVSTLEEQLKRSKENYDAKPNSMEKYIFLRALQDRNEVLFCALLRKHLSEMLPIVYTPTVGEAVEKHGHIYRRARGLFITPHNVGMMDGMARQMDAGRIEVIVVTDGQAILGIGDQGAGGMGIPVGKLALYAVGAGIHPSRCLPICLDVGTNNEKLLKDQLYLGLKQTRLAGTEYSDFIKMFVEGVKRNFPKAILQWEDFSKQNAFNNLDNYREKLTSFNDDIQGTGAMVLGGIICAMKIKKTLLKKQNFLIYGAGAAGIGIARQIRDGLMQEGLANQSALDRIFVLDSGGLLTEDRPEMDEYKKEFAKPERIFRKWMRDNIYSFTLADTIKNGKITALIGVSARPGVFDEKIIKLMMENSPEPLIFPLSNPTSKAEADPRWILEKTGGKAVVSSGSPFPPVTVNGREYRIGQGNNAFIFPGLGLGVSASKTGIITDGLFTAAARALASAVSEEELNSGSIYPPVEKIFDVSRKVAVAVYKKTIEEGTGTPIENGDIEEAVKNRMWIPSYPTSLCKT